MKRRMFLMSGALAPALVAAPAIGPAFGQTAPREHEKDFRILVGFEAGGGADAVARAIAVQLQRRTSRRVRVENRTGTYGALPGEAVRKGPPDGADLALLSSTTLVSRLAAKDFPYDPATDLTPLMEVGTFSIAFAVAPALPVANFDEYLKWLKDGDDPERHKVAVSSNTTFVQVFNSCCARPPARRWSRSTIAASSRSWPTCATAGSPPPSTRSPSLLPPHRGRRARILFTTGTQRPRGRPTIPTATELGYPRLDMEEWFAFFVAPKTPPAIVAELNETLRRVMEDAEMVALMTPLGLTVPDLVAGGARGADRRPPAKLAGPHAVYRCESAQLSGGSRRDVRAGSGHGVWWLPAASLSANKRVAVWMNRRPAMLDADFR